MAKKRIKEDSRGQGSARYFMVPAKAAGKAAPKKQEAGSETTQNPTPAAEVDAPDVNSLVVQNPGMNAASFVNLLKAQGFTITKGKVEPSKKSTKLSSEAEMSNPALNRPAKKRESGIKESGAPCRFIEAAAVANSASNDKYQNRFRVILIQEGMGNTKDGYFYTKDALKSAVPVFEGRKFYADHPARSEEQDRPERSVRDVYGHFENLAFQEAKDGTGQISGDVVVLPDGDSDWIRARLVHAVDYAKKYPDKDFVGLSINASGDAEAMDAKAFLESYPVVQSARLKIEQAIADGLEEIKVVKLIDSAVSCDLVTEAGAKGKVLELLEAEKMAKKHEVEEKKEGESAGHEDPKAGPQGGKDDIEPKEGEDAAAKADAAKQGEEKSDGHDDEEQDKALIMDQLKKHGLVKDGEESESHHEAEGEAHHEAYEAAKALHSEYKAMGHSSEEAAMHAAKAMKCSAAANAKMQAKKEAAEKPAPDAAAKQEGEAHKESASVLKLKGENAKLRESLAVIETEKHLDKVLRESGLDRKATKAFREATKGFKNPKDVDEKFKLFLEGYKATAGGEAPADNLEGCVVAVEKETMRESDGGVSSLDDCVE